VSSFPKLLKKLAETLQEKVRLLVAVASLLAEWQEILGALDGLADTAKENLEIFTVLDKVDLSGVDHKQVTGGIVEKEMFVGLHDLFQIFIADGALVGGVLAAEAFAENVERSLEVDDEVGGGQFGTEKLVVAVVNSEFVVAKVQVGEELVLLEDVIGDHDLLRVTGGGEWAKLLEAADEEGKLGLKGGSGLAIVKSREKRILLGLLHKLAVELLGQKAGKGALAHANGTFYGDIAGRFEEIGHGGGRRMILRFRGSQEA
jgi:hypothetical protein